MVPIKEYYDHIDGLRACAVLLVLMSHLGVQGFSGGFVGVDIFFVISGFLITQQILDELTTTNQFNFCYYFSRRIKRLFPALFFTLAIVFILAIFLLNDAKFNIFGQSLTSSAISFSNVFFFHQAGYFDIFSQSSPLLHTWSLSVEEQFYLLWPLCIWLFFRIKKHTAVFSLMLMLFVLSFVFNLYFQQKNSDMIYYLMPFRIFELASGALLVYFIHRPSSRLFKEILCFFGIACIIYATLNFNDKTLFPSYHALIPVIGALSLIYGAQSYQVSTYRTLTFYPIRYIGMISYSLYLIHWPLIVYTKNTLDNLSIDNEFNALLKIVLFIISLIFASFMYHGIENSFKKTRLKPFSTQYKFILAGILMALLFVLLGKSIQYQSFWSWRTIASTTEDLSTYHYKHWGGVFFHDGIIYQGKTRAPKIILLGDSHAGMLTSGISKYLSKPNNMTTYALFGGGGGKYPSCINLPKLTALEEKVQHLHDTGCRQAYLEALDVLYQSEDSILIISYAYSRQLPRTAYLKNHQLIHVVPWDMESYEEYQPFLDSLDLLRKKIGQRKLILIGDVPGSTYLPSCLNQLKWFAKNCPEVDPVEANRGSIHVNKVLAQYAQSHPNVYFVNPYSAFCNDLFCSSLSRKTKKPFYSDGYHLSITGSNYLLAHLKEDIFHIIQNT